MSIRVLVVDDSTLMRHTLRRVLEAAPGIEVVDTAHDGLDALLKVERLQPDVVTLDVEMPRLDGLGALAQLMQRFPRPVVMLSSLTAAGTEATVRALALGAVDFLQKPSGLAPGGISSVADELVAKVTRAAATRVRRSAAPTGASRPARPALPPALGGSRPEKLLVVGASTGGPRALTELLTELPLDPACAVLIVQHLPAGFTRSLAERLDRVSPFSVAEAQAGQGLVGGQALVAPGDFHLTLDRGRVVLDQGPRRHGVRPSVDTTLESAARSGLPLVAAVLTGMGEDGAAGARAVKAAGGRALVEAESTCVIFGMPRAVIAAGAADEVVPLDHMAAALTRHLCLVDRRVTSGRAHA